MKAERQNKHITIIRLAVLVVPTAVLLLYEYVRMGKVGNLTFAGFRDLWFHRDFL